MKSRHRTLAAVLWTAAATLGTSLDPGAARAQEPSAAPDTIQIGLADARRLALERGPDYLPETGRVAFAEGKLRSARTYPLNPEADAELFGLANDALERPYELRLSQGVEWPGRRGLRIAAAEAGVSGATAEVADAGRLAAAEASRAFYESVAADHRLEAATAILALNERLSAAALTQMGEGAISVMDANFARIEAARSRGRVLGAEREVRTARLALGYLLGATPGTVLLAREEPELPLPVPSELQTEALLAIAASRPDLIAREDEIDRATALARLSRRDAIPDLNLGIVVEGDDSGASPRTGLQLGLSVPIWNRGQGVTDQHVAESRRASLERDAVASRIRTDVRDALQAYAAATEEEALLSDEVLAPVRANQAFLETAYREGEIDLPSLVLLRNQLLDAEMAYWDAWLARRLSLVELERAVGTPDFD